MVNMNINGKNKLDKIPFTILNSKVWEKLEAW